MSAKSLADYAVYIAVRIIVCFIQALPVRTCALVSRHMGWFCWEVLRFRRRVVEENLLIAFPHKTDSERSEIGLEMWRHLLLMLMEIAQAPRKIKRTTWRNYSDLPASTEMLRRLADDRPLVIISGHLGNFEIGGYLLALHGFPTHSVARRLDNPYLNRFINEFRGSSGQYMIDKEGSSGEITDVLARGGTLVLLGDQFAGQGGCWVDFFGRPASTHKAVGLFTLAHQAPTAVSAALRRSSPLTIEMHVADIIDPTTESFEQGTVPLLIEWYTRHLEQFICHRPAQYWWVHRRWKGSPEDRRKRRERRRQQEAA